MQKNQNINSWIEQFLAAEPPRSKSLVMTIFGDAIVPHGGMVWTGSLIELLAPFGVNDRLLRTSVFRLAQEGWLGAQRDGRRSSYAITPDAMRRFSRAFRRIYAPLTAHWNGQWTLVLAADGLDAPARSQLRKELLWEGYSVIAPGIAGHPAGDMEALEALLTRLGLLSKVYVVQATEVPGLRARPLGDMVAEGWDLSEVIAGYEKFAAQFEGLPALLAEAGAGAIEPEQAFVLRTLLIHAYRRVQLHDPQLPVELLPEPWPGARAYELASQLYRQLSASAEQHILTVLQREDPRAPQPESSFYHRFGGLG
ncbi:phenylacetic acid degradation operon negative regulatory protein PaaX [Massilia sp. SR12]